MKDLATINFASEKEKGIALLEINVPLLYLSLNSLKKIWQICKKH